jgi:hypothetical protein
MEKPIAFYNCWRSERDNQIVHVADLVGLAANRHAYAVLNPRTAMFGTLHDTEAAARPDASGVVALGEPFCRGSAASCPLPVQRWESGGSGLSRSGYR